MFNRTGSSLADTGIVTTNKLLFNNRQESYPYVVEDNRITSLDK